MERYSQIPKCTKENKWSKCFSLVSMSLLTTLCPPIHTFIHTHFSGLIQLHSIPTVISFSIFINCTICCFFPIIDHFIQFLFFSFRFISYVIRSLCSEQFTPSINHALHFGRLKLFPFVSETKHKLRATNHIRYTLTYIHVHTHTPKHSCTIDICIPFDKL